MKKIKITLVVLIFGLVLGGAGCSFFAQNQPEQEEITQEPVEIKEEVDISDWQTYTNEEYGLSFRYPGEWGSVFLSNDDRGPFDRGDIFSVQFSNIDIKMYFFSYDYSAGVNEGTANYFDINLDFSLDGEKLKEIMNRRDKGINTPVIDISKIGDNKILKIIGYVGYVRYKASVSYLIKNVSIKNNNYNLFVVYSDNLWVDNH